MKLTVDDILGPQGIIASKLRNYESRPQQLEMARAVAHAIEQKGRLVVEAGTGVGKSFAYLVPAILAAVQAPPPSPPVSGQDQDEAPQPLRIVVSTHTISLQEQLIGKDLPFLESVMPVQFKAVLVKGRGNYVSLRRLNNALSRAGNLFREESEFQQLNALGKWADRTADGSLSSLDFRPWMTVWDEVQSDSGNCFGKQCPTYAKCHYYAARRRMQDAHLMVVNHALFFSDLALRGQGIKLLPDYKVAIFDEAHTMENVAADHLGMSVSSSQVDYTLNKLFNQASNKGLLVGQDLASLEKKTVACQFKVQDFFDEVRAWQETRGRGNGRVCLPKIVSNELSPALYDLAEGLEEHAHTLKNNVHEKERRQDLTAAANRLRALANDLGVWVDQNVSGAVYWLEEQSGRRPRIVLSEAPIEVGPALRDRLFRETPTVVLTSATLSTSGKGGFEFFQSRIGLQHAASVELGSPFDYRRQARIVLLPDMPDPVMQKEAFERRLMAMIRRYVARTDGRTFVLFTSYDLLKRAVAELAPWLAARGLATYSQADGVPRTQMVANFKAQPRGVLFGTDSFFGRGSTCRAMRSRRSSSRGSPLPCPTGR